MPWIWANRKKIVYLISILLMIKNLLLLALACNFCALKSVADDATPTTFTPPYTLNLEDATERGLYTIIDANNDGKTWAGSKYYFRCNTNAEVTADDWLISPGINLEAGSTYNISFIGHNKLSTKPENITMMAGTAPTAEAMTQTVISTVTFTSVQKELHTATFKAPTTGVYYFGFHCTSAKEMYYAYVDGWSIDAPASATSPAAVSELTVKAGAKGALSATVEFTTPTKASDGSDLTALTSATVYNVNTLATVATVSNPALGTKISVVDSNAKNGVNRYRVYCTSASGDGVPADKEAYVGIDVPQAVGRGNWTQDGTSVVITWPAPDTVGVNGGYVDPAGVTYTVSMVQPQYTEIASGVSGTTYTDNSLASLEGQAFLYYAIIPKNKAGEGKGSTTFSGPYGTAYNAPMAESFANKTLTYSPWYIIDYDGGDNSTWDIVSATTSPVLSAQDGDGGFACVYTKDDGSHALTSPMFKLNSQSKLSFWYCHIDRYNDFVLYISEDKCHTWKKLTTLATTKSEWTEKTIDLSAYDGKTINLSFRSTVEAYNKQIALDNIRITDSSSSVERVENGDIYSLNGNVLTVSEGTAPVAVYTVDGKAIYFSQNGAESSIILDKGIYIVRAGNVNGKIAVK